VEDGHLFRSAGRAKRKPQNGFGGGKDAWDVTYVACWGFPVFGLLIWRSLIQFQPPFFLATADPAGKGCHACIAAFVALGSWVYVCSYIIMCGVSLARVRLDAPAKWTTHARTHAPAAFLPFFFQLIKGKEFIRQKNQGNKRQRQANVE